MRLQHLVRDRARLAAGDLAVAAANGQMSYGELDAEANRVARALASLGVGTGDRVALWLPKSTTVIAAMQGALRLGACYVPIDPIAPAAHAARLILDCAARTVVTSADRSHALRAQALRTSALCTDPGGTGPDWELVRSQSCAPLPDPDGSDDDLAYILYTSGSTGAPKGVCLSHRNALAFVDWAAAELQARPQDRFANHAPLHFDLSVLDLYAAFRSGASVHLIRHDLAYAPRLLVESLVRERITVWYSVPSALMLMARDGGLLTTRLPALRALLFAGEVYPIDHLRRLRRHLPGARFLNLYGPTETNVCTFFEATHIPDEQLDPVPIGRACSGDQVWAAREDGTPVAPGEEGELMVDGPTVMLGYWGQPPLSGQPYATGDRVVLQDDGNFQYLGRTDGMVKIRGFRVELGDIEAAIQAHPSVDEVAVMVAGTGMHARIVAYVVAVHGRHLDLLEAKRHCAAILPRQMIVDAVRHVGALPRTGNGKVDRRALNADHVRSATAALRLPV